MGSVGSLSGNPPIPPRPEGFKSSSKSQVVQAGGHEVMNQTGQATAVTECFQKTIVATDNPSSPSPPITQNHNVQPATSSARQKLQALGNALLELIKKIGTVVVDIFRAIGG